MPKKLTPDELDFCARAVRVQESVRAFLTSAHGREPIPVIVTAISYEIARLIASQTLRQSPETLDQMIANVGAVMREQIDAYRAGRLRE